MAEPSATEQLQQIGRWSRQTLEGSRSDLGFQPLPAVWDAVQSDSGNCLGRTCPDYAKCFYFKARKQMFGAQLLIVNHALFFSDLALRRQGGSMLPDYKVVIFDEAHTLEDVAADHLGLQDRPRRRRTLAQQALQPPPATRPARLVQRRGRRAPGRNRPQRRRSILQRRRQLDAPPAARPRPQRVRDPLPTRSVSASRILCPTTSPKS